MKISVIGAGTFGTALANALKKEHEILLFTRNTSVVADINEKRKNLTYFPTKVLSKKIRATSDYAQINDLNFIFLCMPSYAVMEVIGKLSLPKETIIINGAKGFGTDSKLIPESLNAVMPNPVVSMKGPSFANEMIFDVPTAFTIASENPDNCAAIRGLFRKELVVFDYSKDVHGVELLSIIKNIYAIVVGIVDASFNSSNVRFLIFTKALKEMKKLIKFFGICEDTIFCFVGIGDFGLTALNDLSRNRTIGLLIGKGFLSKDVHNMVVLEGVRSIDNVIHTLPAEAHNQLPLLHNLSKLFSNNISVRAFINEAIYN